MKTMRCFLAFKLGLETAENITEAQKRLKSKCASAGMTVRWVPPPNIHMTVLFLGEITEPMATAIKDMLEPVIHGFETFDLTSVGMGAFPDVSNPKVIWAGLGAGAETCAAIHTAVQERLESTGFYFSNKPFTAHVTVGRVKAGPPGAPVSCFGDDVSQNFGTSTIRHLHCFQSDLSASGAEYTSLWALPLKKPSQKQTRPITPERPASEPETEGTPTPESAESQPFEESVDVPAAAEPSKANLTDTMENSK